MLIYWIIVLNINIQSGRINNWYNIVRITMQIEIIKSILAPYVTRSCDIKNNSPLVGKCTLAKEEKEMAIAYIDRRRHCQDKVKILF